MLERSWGVPCDESVPSVTVVTVDEKRQRAVSIGWKESKSQRSSALSQLRTARRPSSPDREASTGRTAEEDDRRLLRRRGRGSRRRARQPIGPGQKLAQRAQKSSRTI